MAKRFAQDALEAALKIDKHSLDDECIRQPDLYYQVAEELALCTSERDAAKVHLTETQGGAAARLREELEAANPKVTVTMVDAAVATDAAVKKARKDFLHWSEQVLVIEALKEAYQQRSYMLTQLTALYVNSYYNSEGMTPSGRAVRDVDAARGKAALAARRRLTPQED